jgi:hypothetical protein
VSIKDPGWGIEAHQVQDAPYRPGLIHEHNRMTALGAGPDETVDGAGVQEGQLGEVQDDGLAMNHDPVDLFL